MGTKKKLAETISALCKPQSPGPFLDLFSGISAAGKSVAPDRQIWCNDAQVFSRTLTEALYLSKQGGPRVNIASDWIKKLGDENFRALADEFREQLDKEARILCDGTPDERIGLQDTQRIEADARRTDLESKLSHCLFTTRYAGSYIGLAQAIQIDAIRYGADRALESH